MSVVRCSGVLVVYVFPCGCDEGLKEEVYIANSVLCGVLFPFYFFFPIYFGDHSYWIHKFVLFMPWTPCPGFCMYCIGAVPLCFFEMRSTPGQKQHQWSLLVTTR